MAEELQGERTKVGLVGCLTAESNTMANWPRRLRCSRSRLQAVALVLCHGMVDHSSGLT